MSQAAKPMKRLSVFTDMLLRTRLGALFTGKPFDGKRDMDEVFGWPKSITSEDCMQLYNRGGIARRIAHAYPSACWGRPPEIYVDNTDGVGDPEWDQAWKDFVKKFDLWQVLYRLDVLASLGRYGILLCGTDRGPTNTTLRGKLLYMQPYGESMSTITRWVTDTTSPNYGKPAGYRTVPIEQERNASILGVTTIPMRPQLELDASRVLHIAHGALEDSVFGRPIYASIYNYLIDLQKVIGSSSESYWLNSYRGMSLDIDKDMELDPDDEASLSAEVDEYLHGFRRFIRTRGTKVTALGADTADPSGAFKVIITLISGTTGIPQRVLLGSEAGQLASTQDKGNWAERVEEYRTLHAEPYVLGPLVKMAIEAGWVPEPKGGFEKIVVNWPDAYRMSPLERGQTSAQTARTLANAMKAMEPVIVGYTQEKVTTPGTPATTGPDGSPGNPGTPASTEIRETPIYGEPLITREEARAIIGLSTDNKVMAVDPKI